MTGIVLLGLLAGLPIAFIFLTRTNGAIVFLALCTGSVLTKYVTQDALNIAHSFVPGKGEAVDSAVKITLLLLPAVLTAVFLRKSANGAKAVLNIVPAAVTGVLTALLVVPLLPLAAQSNVTVTPLWDRLLQFQSFVVGLGVLASMFLLWTTHKSHGHGRRGKRRHAKA